VNNFEGMNPRFSTEFHSGDLLEFDSKFESGNLDRVVAIGQNEYDLYMRADTNTRGHN